MLTDIELIFLIYIAAVSVISFFVCVYDKIAAKKFTKHRTRESTLLWLSALGGSFVMFFTMVAIRHKTKHVKFMLGIPLIITLQVIALAVYVFLIR